ncbi:MAG: hypothetical protein KF841_16080, partial [Phycisphaerae bacterium]|nr:hypothetical protein [Phycisphaerae bacterium]
MTTDYRRIDCEDAFANDRVTIETIFERDHLLRVTEAGNRLTHPDQAPYDNVGIYGYAYQSNKSFNVTAENQFMVTYQIGTLEANRAFDYDTLDRLIEAELTDSPDWSAVAMQT